MKKHIKLLTIGTLLLGGLTGCNDFLDREPLDKVIPEKYFASESDLAAYTINAYPFETVTDAYGINFFGKDNDTDNQASGDSPAFWIPGQKKVPSGEGEWDWSKIRTCNYFFDNTLPKFEAGTITGNQDNVKHYIGEMYVIRAYNYYKLLVSLGDLPIITTALPDIEETLVESSKRQPRNKVARFILDDLQKATELLLDKSPGGKNRISKNVAHLLRARVALFEATWEKYHKGVNTLGYHEIYINGRKVGEDVLTPAVSHLSKRSLIVTYDITPYLREGENDLLIWLGQGWYKTTTFGAAYEGPLVKAELDVLRNGKWEVVTKTDGSWYGRESGYSDTGTWRALQFGGERVDGRILPRDLSTHALDKMKWTPVVKVNVPDHIASPQMCEVNKIHQILQAVSVKKLGESLWLVDMGKVQTGWFEMQMPILPAGHEVIMEYSDNLTKDGEFDKQGESDIYISGGKQGEYFRNKFNHHAFRYVRISNLPQKPETGAMKSLQIYGDYKQTATFECSDADLNAIHQMIQYTMKCLTFSGYMVDCPHLERAGYGGDGNSSTMSLQTMYDVAPTFENWVQTWGDSMREGGSLPHVGPNPGAGGGGPYWCGFFVQAPWRTYVNYNDPRLIEKYYSQMKEWFKYVDKYTVDGLLKRWPDTKYRDWYLGDWLAPMGVDAGNQASVDLVSNCFISECLSTMYKTAITLGKREEAEEFAIRREKLNKLIHQTFYREDEGIYSTGSQLDMCYPMLVGVVPDSLYNKVKENVVAMTEEKYKGHLP